MALSHYKMEKRICPVSYTHLADSDYAVVGVVRDRFVHGFEHSLGRLACAERLLEYELALEAKLLHEGLVDELIGEDHVALAELELRSEVAEVRELVNGRGDDDLSLVCLLYTSRPRR